MTKPMLETIKLPSGKKRIRFNFHKGQRRAMASKKRFVCVMAGAQSGKTETGPAWLLTEMKRQGPGDYIVISPSYKLMKRKALPAFMRLFRRFMNLGKWNGSDHIFAFTDAGEKRLFKRVSTDGTKVFFCHAQDPEGVESATAKAAWADEAGAKKFRLGAYEGLLRRLAIHQGRLLITTTPYDLSWLYKQLYQPWEQSKGKHPDIDVINFRSIDNPAFPRAEWERAKASLPPWKFMLFHEGIPTHPAGMIYDCFDSRYVIDGGHVCKPFRVPELWPRYSGHDFGDVNGAAVFLAEELDDRSGKPTNNLYLYREYHPGQKMDAGQHVPELLDGEPGHPHAVGGSASENNWRERFAAAGFSIFKPPVRDVEVGIDSVYGTIRRGELRIFDTCTEILDELASYSREILEDGTVTQDIADKSSYHLLDSLRYLLSDIRPVQPVEQAPEQPEGRAGPLAAISRAAVEGQIDWAGGRVLTSDGRERGTGEDGPEDGWEDDDDLFAPGGGNGGLPW